MPKVQFRRIIAQGIGGGVKAPTDSLSLSQGNIDAPNKSVGEMTLEEQLQQKRLENPNGYIPANMSEVEDVTTVRGQDAYNAAQTAAEFHETIAAITPHMARAAALAEQAGDYPLAEQIDTMLREAAGGKLNNIGNWLAQSKIGQGLGRFFSGKPRGWDELEEWGSTTGNFNPDAWAWDNPNPRLRNNFVRDPQHQQPLVDEQFHQPFNDLSEQQAAWGAAQLAQGDSGRTFNVRTPDFGSLQEQINFDKNLNRGVGIAGAGALGAAGLAAKDAMSFEQRKAEYETARQQFQQSGGHADPVLSKAYMAYTQALLRRGGDVNQARANFQALIRSRTPGPSANPAGPGSPQPAVGSRWIKPRGANSIRATVRFAAAAKGREKGNLDWHGLKLYIENPKNSWREKTGSDGKKWKRKMSADYGRINGTKGADGDCIDTFIGPHDDSTKCYVVDQIDKNSKFDEHKCVLGVKSKAEAKALYLSNYPKGWKTGGVKEFTLPEFKRWLDKGDKNRPACESS